MPFEFPGMDYFSKIRSIQAAFFGMAVGDALGVPIEFQSREHIAENPVTEMRGFGTHKQPPGTWSDDSSLAFCLAEALSHELDINAIAQNFVKWQRENFWTPWGEVFDIGIATNQAIARLALGHAPELAGGKDVSSNGNGSLMRILPLLFYLENKDVEERFQLTRKVSSLTHGHIRSVIACFYYLEFARRIMQGMDKMSAYRNLQEILPEYLLNQQIPSAEIDIFYRLFKGKIHALESHEIESGGYVLHTLEASIFCLLTTESYQDAVLKAVNLGLDSDTTGAVTGGLAGLLYSMESIPEKWIGQIARKGDIALLAEQLAGRLYGIPG